MAKIVEVVPLDNLAIYIKYSDGVKGKLNLSRLIKKKEYEPLKNPAIFNSVRVDPKTKDIVWDGGMSICKVAVYNMLKLREEMKSIKLDLDKI